MAANPITDFDLGPLTWVKTEIDHSLNQARESLDKLAANPADRAPVKYIRTHLHQATGALAMVGLAPATRFNEELEKLVAFLESLGYETLYRSAGYSNHVHALPDLGRLDFVRRKDDIDPYHAVFDQYWRARFELGTEASLGTSPRALRLPSRTFAIAPTHESGGRFCTCRQSP